MKPRDWMWLAITCACAQDGAGAFDARTIEGRVLDERTERGVVGAKVAFVSDALDRAETVSGDDGDFVLDAELTEGVRFGTLEASRSGYEDSPVTSVYFDGSALRVELRLRPRP